MCCWYLSCNVLCCFFFFFFQAEDGIRDLYVTGVQTCALPILKFIERELVVVVGVESHEARAGAVAGAGIQGIAELGERRSEERRVGKECRSRWSADH